jgi:hypothetical protein
LQTALLESELFEFLLLAAEGLCQSLNKLVVAVDDGLVFDELFLEAGQLLLLGPADLVAGVPLGYCLD